MKRIPKPLAIAAAIGVAVVLSGCQRDDLSIRFAAPPEGEIVIGIHDAAGRVVQQFTRKGEGILHWDGRVRDGQLAPAGEYRWSFATHRGFGTRPSGAACGHGSPASTPPAERHRWGGKGGAPSAVAADDLRMVLGWSGGEVTACDLDGRVEWSVALPEGAACRGLAVDGGTVFVHARDASGDQLMKFRANDGTRLDWAAGPALPIVALWPAAAETKPTRADAMTARVGRIYLTFSDLQFFAVLRSDSGEYLETFVGPSASCMDVTPTKTEASDGSGKIVDADFAVVALHGGALGKVLFAHEPLWVILSDFQPLDRDERITAITLLGDGVKHHQHSVFVALDAPFHQVQRRAVLASEGFLWLAGRAGGRALSGPWVREVLGRVNALALDARGRLWIAEGDAVPPRFSVWSTEGNQGRLEQEFFGPVSPHDTGAALLPGNPGILAGAGCEWRIDSHGEPARCLGVITRNGMAAAEFRAAKSGAFLLHVRHPDGTSSVFERRGEGDYVPRESSALGDESWSPPAFKLSGTDVSVSVARDGSSGPWRVRTSDGLDLGSVGTELSSPAIVQDADGRIFGVRVDGGLFRIELTGLDSIRRLPGKKLLVRPGK